MSAPLHLVRLGEVLDLRVAHDGKIATLSWRGTHSLCADTTRRRLYILPAKKGARELLDGELGELEKVYRAWHQFEPSSAVRRKVRLGPARARGTVLSIGYRSNKWSRHATDYEHHFDTPPRLTQLGELYRIAGPKVRVTPRGITG